MMKPHVLLQNISSQVSHLIITAVSFTIFSTAHAQWTTIAVPLLDSFHDIEALSDKVVVVYTYGSGKVLRTRDGGKHWDTVFKDDSTYWEQIQFVNKKTGWIIGEHGSILKTTDGGERWVKQAVTSEDGQRLLLYGISMKNENEGWVSGGIINKGKSTARFYVTKNGGNTWTEVLSVADCFSAQLKIAQDGTLWSCENNQITQYAPDGFRSNIRYRDSLKQTGQLRDLELLNTEILLAASFNGKILRSTDAGVTWKVVYTTGSRLRSIKKINEHAILAAGDRHQGESTLYVSHDNGLSWESIENSFPDIHRISMSKKYVWICGKNGMIAKSAIQSLSPN